MPVQNLMYPIRIYWLCRGFHLLGRFHDLFDAALEEERLLRNIVVLAVENFLEAAYRVFDLDILALDAGELLGDMKGLREEAPNLARARR